MERSDLCWLLALCFFLVFLVLSPLLGFALFGSDTGEYYRLTVLLITTGHEPVGAAYAGWGFGYPDFPGIFILAGATAQGMGVGALAALIFVVPVVAVLSVLPLFLLFRRLFPNDTIAILGAGFASVAMPRLFSLAHPAPLALGDFLVVAGLWMFVEGRTDPRWYLPLALTSGALIVTHHLSSFFFALSAIGTLALFELIRPGGWSRRFPLRELVFTGGFLTVLWAYWVLYAVDFRSIVLHGFGPFYSTVAADPVATFLGLTAASFFVLALAGLLLRWRRSSGTVRPLRVKFPGDRQYSVELSLFFVGIAGGVALLLVVPLPGTSQTTTPLTLLYFGPLLILLAFAAGGRRLLTSARLGGFIPIWIAALALGVILSGLLIAVAPSFSSSQALSPGRFAEYLLIPMGLMVAVGIGRLVGRTHDVAGRRAAVAAGLAVVVLFAANAAIVYPPPAIFGGFQEGLTAQDAAEWMWIGIALPPTAAVASDHRLSSMIFGFDGNPATWDSTPGLFVGSNRTLAWSELNDSPTPSVERPINAVAIDGVMYTGVALDPSQIAQPLSASAIAWFQAPPFVPIYEDQRSVVYWVAWSGG
ncbi:MAG: hypothetical protein WA761_10270 [Thermoplasmata archaeon]